MTRPLPMFPLNTVLFPGMSVPLRVFEDRYRALVHALLRVDDPAERLFGSVAIREGWEVGEHGRQSLHTVGCLLQLTDVEANPDGTFDVVAVARGRLRMHSLDASGAYPVAQVDLLPDEHEDVDPEVVEDVREAFGEYVDRLAELRGQPLHEGPLPADPAYLSWSIAASALLTLRDRQALLEAEDAHLRLAMLGSLLREELRHMRALPSLPAVQVARTAWSPN